MLSQAVLPRLPACPVRPARCSCAFYPDSEIGVTKRRPGRPSSPVATAFTRLWRGLPASGVVYLPQAWLARPPGGARVGVASRGRSPRLAEPFRPSRNRPALHALHALHDGYPLANLAEYSSTLPQCRPPGSLQRRQVKLAADRATMVSTTQRHEQTVNTACHQSFQKQPKRQP
jgi:hypothetical protein